MCSNLIIFHATRLTNFSAERQPLAISMNLLAGSDTLLFVLAFVGPVLGFFAVGTVCRIKRKKKPNLHYLT